MKRILIVFLCCVLGFMLILPCFAVSAPQTQVNEDGSYFVVCDEPRYPDVIDPDHDSDPPTAGAPEISSMSKIIQLLKSFIEKIMQLLARFKGEPMQEVTKTKYIYYYSAESKLLWSGKLTGVFAYSASGARCKDASFAFDSYDGNWSLSGYNCTKNGATASVTFGVVQRSLGVKLQTIEKTLTMTCDTSGNVQ